MLGCGGIDNTFMMGCFESRGGAGKREQSHQGERPEQQTEVKKIETVSYHPDRDRKLTLSMVSRKDKRYWEYEFKGT